MSAQPSGHSEPHADPVLAALRVAEAAYHEEQAVWKARTEQLQAAAVEQRRRADCLERALREIHGAMFGGDVYRLILQACLTMTESTRGVYVTVGRDTGRLRVRAQIGIEVADKAAPPAFIDTLARQVLEAGDTLVCNGPPAQVGLPGFSDMEPFRNFVAAPVVLMADLDGVVIAADRSRGEYDRFDVDSLLAVGGQAAVAVRNRRLERELQHAYLSTVSMLADAVEAKDPSTHGHCEMASRYARMVAERMGLEGYDLAVVCYSALLHDVGKIAVSDGVLNKPGPLLPEEVQLMRAHVRVGHDLLSGVPALGPVAEIVLRHHEWYDGGGYPDGLSGDEIPLAARIVSAVDAYCAMLARRSYKEAYPPEAARAELRRCAGSQFDPEVVEALMSVLDDPISADPDSDFDAECGMLPQFVLLAETGRELAQEATRRSVAAL